MTASNSNNNRWADMGIGAAWMAAACMVIWCFGMAGGLKDSATGITDGEKVIILDSLATNKQMNAV